MNRYRLMNSLRARDAACDVTHSYDITNEKLIILVRCEVTGE
ncbi:hypothetical protein KGM_203633 [Danaus plexippus plexippus]|uniref:Uncharacterized protein n=1 Tax=Danaus plexippus plexippus TaxID=278856 RepID=A0A212EPJ1_DANPL|nr:hypothetical protein KGM_203633 [Danaus plexippus plexippus]